MGSYVHSSNPEWIEINDNQASYQSPVSEQFSYSLDPYKDMPIGYWFDDSRNINVPPGTGPWVIHVPVHPAGAIYGKILRPDGSTAKHARASLLVIKRPNFLESGPGHLLALLNNRTSLGTFNATPLPLGGTYAIMAHEDYRFAMTEPFTLDQATPMREADLQLPQGVTITGRLLNERGEPATNPVSLNVSVKRGEFSSGLGGPEVEPDEHGRFVFENVNPGPEGTCKIRVIGQAGYRPLNKTIEDLSKPLVLQLERGHRVTGTVIDQATGWPVPGIEVYAQSAKNPQGDYMSNWELLEADAKTDDAGRFEFTNMDTCYYRLGVRGANLVDKEHPVVVMGGQPDAITLHVECLPWSNIKPKQPE